MLRIKIIGGKKYMHTTIESLSSEAHAALLSEYPHVRFPVEQSPEWGEFQDKISGRTNLGVQLIRQDQKPVAVALPVALTMRGYSYVWINQGPVWLTAPTAEQVDAVAKCLRDFGATLPQKNLLFVRGHFPYAPKIAAPAYSTALIQKTTAIDLAQDFETILASMHQGARRSMRKAAKAGVQVREVAATQAAADFTPYYDILTETASRDGFFVHPMRTYQTMLGSLPHIVRFFVAFAADKPVAWAIVTSYRSTGIYYYGASSSHGRQLEAPYLLHVEIMRQLQQEGCTSYDFLGIGSKSYPGLQGVTQFKLKFGGPEIDYVPAYDIAINSAKYHLWKIAQAARRRLR